MAFPDFDVFAGSEKRKLEFDVDRHGHKDFMLKPTEAQGWPNARGARGLYIGYVGDGRWRIGGHTKSPTSAVIHSVVERPATTPQQELPALLLENQDGRFVDVTARLGISVLEQTTSSAVGDFNNDGWADIFVVRYGNPSQHNKQILFLNQGGKTFEQIADHGIISRELGATGGGAETIDYDADGDLDLIFCNERGRWHLFTNENAVSPETNFLVVNVGNSPSGDQTPLGATLTVAVNGRTYRRVVGAGSAAFSHSANTHLHIGLGDSKAPMSGEVRWSNGETQAIAIDELNRTYEAGQKK